MFRRWTWVVLLAVGCFQSRDDAGDDYGYMPDQLPSGNCQETGSGGGSDTGCDPERTTGGSASECQATDDCTAAQSCIAPFDGDLGPFTCQPICLELRDEVFWCADASACCDPNAVCSPRGYCLLPASGTTSGDASTGGSTTGGASTG